MAKARVQCFVCRLHDARVYHAAKIVIQIQKFEFQSGHLLWIYYIFPLTIQ